MISGFEAQCGRNPDPLETVYRQSTWLFPTFKRNAAEIVSPWNVFLAAISCVHFARTPDGILFTSKEYVAAGSNISTAQKAVRNLGLERGRRLLPGGADLQRLVGSRKV
jgi:hypothetical protein